MHPGILAVSSSVEPQREVVTSPAQHLVPDRRSALKHRSTKVCLNGKTLVCYDIHDICCCLMTTIQNMMLMSMVTDKAMSKLLITMTTIVNCYYGAGGRKGLQQQKKVCKKTVVSCN